MTTPKKYRQWRRLKKGEVIPEFAQMNIGEQLAKRTLDARRNGPRRPVADLSRSDRQGPKGSLHAPPASRLQRRPGAAREDVRQQDWRLWLALSDPKWLDRNTTRVNGTSAEPFGSVFVHHDDAPAFCEAGRFIRVKPAGY